MALETQPSRLCLVPQGAGYPVAGRGRSDRRISDCYLLQKNISGVVFWRIGLAHGSVAYLLARRLPLVSALVAAISHIAFDAAHYCLDCEHYPYLLHVALERT